MTEDQLISCAVTVQNEPQYVSRLEAKINLELGRKVVEKIMVLPQVSKAIVLCGM